MCAPTEVGDKNGTHGSHKCLGSPPPLCVRVCVRRRVCRPVTITILIPKNEIADLEALRNKAEKLAKEGVRPNQIGGGLGVRTT